MQRYIDAGGGEVIAGHQIAPFTIPFGNNQEISIRSGNGEPGTSEAGMIYYTVSYKQQQEQEQIAPSTEPTWKKIVKGAVIVVVIGGAIALAPETGGASLVPLLAF